MTLTAVWYRTCLQATGAAVLGAGGVAALTASSILAKFQRL